MSDSELFHLLNGEINLYNYKDLKNIGDVDELLSSKGAVVILYPAADDYNGHWVCLFFNKNDKGEKIVEFFDSYGMSLDTEFKHTKVSHPRYIAKLLYKGPYKVEWNHHKFQQGSSEIGTCGKHVVWRLLNRHMTMNLYNKMFGSEPGVANGDEIVHWHVQPLIDKLNKKRYGGV